MTVNITTNQTSTYTISTVDDYVFLADILVASGNGIIGQSGGSGSTIDILGTVTSTSSGINVPGTSSYRVVVAPTGVVLADDFGIFGGKDILVAGYVRGSDGGLVTGESDARITVSGIVEARDDGITATGVGSRIDITASGVVRGGGDGDGFGFSAAVYFTGTLHNAGTIIAETFGSPVQQNAIEALPTPSVQTVVNTGLVVGNVLLFAGDDLYDGSGGGVVTGTIDLGAGADRILGGSGVDRLTYATSNAGVTVDLVNGVGSGGHAEGDRISGVEYLIGSAHEDTLIGDATANNIMGGDSRDLLLGGAQGDVLRGEGGNDLIGGGEGWDWIEGGEGNDGLDAGSGNDWVFGGSGNDTLIGDAGDDTLAGEAGSDTYTGGTGADLFRLDVLGGVDTVTDFTPGADRLRVDGATQNTATIVANAVQTDGGSTILVLENSTQVALLGVTGITADWFA